MRVSSGAPWSNHLAWWLRSISFQRPPTFLVFKIMPKKAVSKNLTRREQLVNGHFWQEHLAIRRPKVSLKVGSFIILHSWAETLDWMIRRSTVKQVWIQLSVKKKQTQNLTTKKLWHCILITHLLLFLLYYHSKCSSVLVRIPPSPTASSLSCFLLHLFWWHTASLWCLYWASLSLEETHLVYSPNTGCNIMTAIIKCLPGAGIKCLLHVCDIWRPRECVRVGFVRRLRSLKMKRSGWHQNWQVRNICALTASRQIGRLGDGMDYPWCAWGFGEPSWNKQFPPFCNGWMRIQWLYWLDGVSQTTEQKEKHGQEKQSHLTSEERLLLKFRSRYTLPQVCHSSLVMSSLCQRTIHITWHNTFSGKFKPQQRETMENKGPQPVKIKTCAAGSMLLLLINLHRFEYRLTKTSFEAAVWVVFLSSPSTEIVRLWRRQERLAPTKRARLQPSH